jgi:hypothetical protein
MFTYMKFAGPMMIGRFMITHGGMSASLFAAAIQSTPLKVRLGADLGRLRSGGRNTPIG